MGYYSDIRVSTTKEGFEFIKRVSEGLLEKSGSNKKSLIGRCNYTVDVSDENGIVFGWDCVKWYREFQEVNAIMNALSLADLANIPLQYCEVGEDNDTDFWESDTALKLHHYIEPLCKINIYNR